MRLIDADAFYKKIEEIRMEYLEEDTLSSKFAAEIIETVMDSYLQDAPTIDPVKQEWVSVKDRLPKEEDDVLVLIREIEHYGRHKEKRNVYHWIFTGWFIDGVWATTYCHGYKKIETENEEYPNCEHTVTHWMPLPEPPKEGE